MFFLLFYHYNIHVNTHTLQNAQVFIMACGVCLPGVTNERQSKVAMRSILLIALVHAALAFQPSTPVAPRRLSLHEMASPLTLLRCAEGAGKGFGSASTPPPKKKKVKNAAAVAARAAAQRSAQGIAPTPTPTASPSDPDDPSVLTAEERGRRALEAMRRSSGSDPSVQLKKPGMNLTPEELAPEPDSVMPPAVADRMLKRIIPFAALPVVGGVVLFGAFYYANVQMELDVPPTIVAYATQAMLLLSFAGITYGVMSTQLDEDAEQTALGVDNVKRNLDIMRGVEDERIAETKEYEDMLDAQKQGIIMKPGQMKTPKE